MAVKILVVDDHPLFLAGILAVIGTDASLSVVGQAENGEIAIKKAKELQPDIVIMDISMPGIDGIEATKLILEQSEKIKVLALSIHTGKRFVKEMLNAGASGYLPKDIAADEILIALDQIAKGNMYLSPTITSIALTSNDEPSENISSPILKTKLHRPQISNDYIIREKIIEKLEKNRENPLSLIVAPAGYGKSVTVSEWLDKTDALYAWVSLDDEHNQLRVFLNYLIYALDGLFPGQFMETNKMVNASDLPPIKTIVLTFINELDYIKQDFILVLDDYHKISNEHIHSLISELLTYPPECMHLSIITRRDPPINHQRLRINNRILDIRMKDLAFNEQEVSELFLALHQTELKDGLVKSIVDKTEGWITGICLAIMNITDTDLLENLPLKEGSDLYPFSEFLVEEALSKLDANFQHTLLSISVLDRFCADLIDSFLCIDHPIPNISKGESFLDELINTNLFIIPLDNENKWYRFHHLFQELLQTQFKKHASIETFNTSHLVASTWFNKNNFIEEAISYAVKSGELSTAASIIENQREDAVNNDKWYVLEEWLAFLPDTMVYSRPGLIMAKSWVLLHHMQFEDVFANMELVDKLCGDDKQYDSIIGEVALFRGYMLYFLGDGNGSLVQLATALDKIPFTFFEARAQTEVIYALSSQMIGEDSGAIPFLDKQLAGDQPSNLVRTSRLLVTYVFIFTISGEFTKAIKANNKLFAAIENRLNYGEAWSRHLYGLNYFFLFELDKAIEFLIGSVDQRFIHFKRAAVDAMTTLMLAYQVNGQTNKANEVLVLLQDYLSLTNDPSYQLLLSSAKLRLAVIQGDKEEVVKLRRTFVLPPVCSAMIWWVDIPEITNCRGLIAENTKASLDEADSALATLNTFSKAHNNTLHLIEILSLQALVFFKKGNPIAAKRTIIEALILAQPNSFIFPFIELGQELEALLIPVELEGIKSFVNRICSVLNRGAKVLDTRPINPLVSSSKIDISGREKDILLAVADGYRNKEIANKLFISENTVKKHIYNIFQKFGVKNRISLVEKTRAAGLLQEE